VPGSSVILPTYNRPEELSNCIESLLRQTIKPDEIIVIDDGNLETPPLREACEAAGIVYRYHKKDTPGLTASRNVGIAMASHEIIMFLDDDVVLDPGYIEAILRVYEADPQQEIGGVGGQIMNWPTQTLAHRFRHWFDVVALNSGQREGMVLPSGFCTNYGETGRPLKTEREVDFLAGGVSSFRRQIFEAFSFSESYTGYGLGEDKDFSYRVSKAHKLVLAPDAQLDHFEAPQERYDRRRMGYEYVVSRYRFFMDHKDHGWPSRLLFSYALAGYAVARTAIMLCSFKKQEFGRMAGILSAIRDIMTGAIRHEQSTCSLD
jgi:GT2 family glycosyltransferase